MDYLRRVLVATILLDVVVGVFHNDRHGEDGDADDELEDVRVGGVATNETMSTTRPETMEQPVSSAHTCTRTRDEDRFDTSSTAAQHGGPWSSAAAHRCYSKHQPQPRPLIETDANIPGPVSGGGITPAVALMRLPTDHSVNNKKCPLLRT